MANKRVIELNERTTIQLADWLLVDDSTGTKKLSMATLISYLSYSAIIFVDQLPTTDINPNMLYLVPHTGSVTEFDEYVYRDSQWTLLGVSVLDLTSIYQTRNDNDLQTTSKAVVGAINELKSALNNMVNARYEGNLTNFLVIGTQLRGVGLVAEIPTSMNITVTSARIFGDDSNWHDLVSPYITDSFGKMLNFGDTYITAGYVTQGLSYAVEITGTSASN